MWVELKTRWLRFINGPCKYLKILCETWYEDIGWLIYCSLCSTHKCSIINVDCSLKFCKWSLVETTRDWRTYYKKERLRIKRNLKVPSCYLQRWTKLSSCTIFCMLLSSTKLSLIISYERLFTEIYSRHNFSCIICRQTAQWLTKFRVFSHWRVLLL